MTKIALGALLLLSFATVQAQTAPTAPAIPPPVPATSAAAPARAAAAGNPFAPRAAEAAPAAAPSASLPQAAVPLTEDMVKANVEASFRAQGTRVGRVNGQTFFKLDADKHYSYLFVPTGLTDSQPVVPQARTMSQPPASESPISTPMPPHVPMPSATPANK